MCAVEMNSVIILKISFMDGSLSIGFCGNRALGQAGMEGGSSWSPQKKKDQEEKPGPNWAHTEDSLRDNQTLNRQVRSSDNATGPPLHQLGYGGTPNIRHY